MVQPIRFSRRLAHIRKITDVYRWKCRLICELFEELLLQLSHTRTQGGRFLLAILPQGISSREVFDAGVRQGVPVLPLMPFYVGGGGTDTIRLNFSSASEAENNEGMHRFARVITGIS